MDSPAVNRLFRQLASHHFCRSHAVKPRLLTAVRQCRRKTTRARPHHQAPPTKTTLESSWQQRTSFFPADKAEEFKKYPFVTSDSLRSRRERPRRVKMLMRDFIEDSLYNPNYGYFSKHVTIFSNEHPFDFPSIKDEPDFYRQLSQRYAEFEDKLDEDAYDEARQLWHTPTELFKPYYGEAIARYMVANYKLSLYPYHDLVIYELGAGNGTLMLNILDYIRHTDSEVYARTKYCIIEVSSALAQLQARNLAATAASRGHAGKVEIINKSIFDWNTYVSTPCFFLALEVFDNFAHDIMRYDPATSTPMQGSVLIDAEGDFYEFYTRSVDPVAARFLRVRDAACQDRNYAHPLRSSSKLWRSLRHSLPFAPNLTLPEYIPTRLMQFFSILGTRFPAHRLVTSDFHTLPDATPGFNSPVVQTRFNRRTIPVTTPLVHQGFFDILFPTDFGVMEDMYRAITGRLTRVMTQEDFFRRWAYMEDTQMRSGENALLDWYKNASVMVTV
ncbi:S-adenosyl-L-methionine-dependent methyltransferase [Neohortaea acidophila]|uniref:Protein arginine methyltransferase NDUFAF7 n=1 Tax=Neohortaea acidophila TaxID=245834 RepID=A0A6A6Q042_9PEZI|nr:S-adenosyl-L-methionine-dependent methyltransferase [Neohortaea acidophila]KAF2485349.1 S-adenosyl-L-methionine-dependent methyltransferase [Neohortaea acidophila]